jgi:hypothetical protein
MMKRKQLPESHGAGTLAAWLGNAKNRARMYQYDQEDAAELKRMSEDEAVRPLDEGARLAELKKLEARKAAAIETARKLVAGRR